MYRVLVAAQRQLFRLEAKTTRRPFPLTILFSSNSPSSAGPGFVKFRHAGLRHGSKLRSGRTTWSQLSCERSQSIGPKNDSCSLANQNSARKVSALYPLCVVPIKTETTDSPSLLNCSILRVVVTIIKQRTIFDLGRSVGRFQVVIGDSSTC